MMNMPEQFYKEFVEIIDPNVTGVANLKIIIKKLNRICEKAWLIDAEKTDGIFGSWVVGTKENKSLGNRFAYDACIKQHNGTLNYLNNFKSNPQASKDVLANLFINDFKNFFELDAKILVNLVCIDRLIHDQDYSFESLYFESAGSLINRLRQSHTNWDFIIDRLNKKVRNASSHLNFVYNCQTEKFIGKDVDRRNHSIKKIEIPLNDFFFKLLPGQASIVEGFIAVGILLWLKKVPVLHQKALNILN